MSSASSDPYTVGSLCSGYGGLEMGLARVLDVDVRWHAEIDPAAARVLAHRWPTVPNLGDLTAVDWATVEPADIVCAGFPCQPLSNAGRRAGTADRRWLFDDIAAAVGRMDPRPRMLLLENVPGLLTANRGEAMARVVHALARLGYVGSWRLVRACDVGAPHRRERLFLVARLADTPSVGRRRRPGGRGMRRPAQVGSEAGRVTRDGPPVPSDAVRAGARGNDRAVPRPAHGPRRPGVDVPPVGNADPVDWGRYGPAIRRWAILTRPEPPPKDDDGRHSPAFVEWLMGLPAGHVTDTGLPRTAMLRVLGNGVVPQQAAHALGLLLP